MRRRVPTYENIKNAISAKSLYADSRLEIIAFFMPSKSFIPLHDHPGMTIFSKILHGKVKVEAYDFIREDGQSPSCG